ncbi:MAG: hypothetical protein EHM12_10805 [Dehalococcoidia bacterium]|nr:MAG: hypothetical protein EHM12_10805 [Dehalococcoidia bacterium]
MIIKKILIALILFLSNVAYGATIPPAPTGYEWGKFRDANCSFLVPKGWYVLQKIREEVPEVYITKENMEKSGRYDTGVIIQGLKKDKLKGLSIDDIIKRYESRLNNSGEILAQTKSNEGSFSTKSFLTLLKKDGVPVLMMHLSLIVNQKTETLYTIRFDTPPDSWDKQWPTVELIIHKIILDPNF